MNLVEDHGTANAHACRRLNIVAGREQLGIGLKVPIVEIGVARRVHGNRVAVLVSGLWRTRPQINPCPVGPHEFIDAAIGADGDSPIGCVKEVGCLKVKLPGGADIDIGLVERAKLRVEATGHMDRVSGIYGHELLTRVMKQRQRGVVGRHELHKVAKVELLNAASRRVSRYARSTERHVERILRQRQRPVADGICGTDQGGV